MARQEKESAETFFTQQLVAWYRRNRRDLPWRRTNDPYHVWVSEVMLQQTRVETVIPYYERFIARFPTVEALADAPEEEVLKLWEGLGYYSRARNLQAAVREVKERYNGRVPDTPEQIRSLKGVGPYTAGAILSIAYNLPQPAVDGNVMRVLSRYFYIPEDIALGSTRTKMEERAASLIPRDAAGDFNQALMELGALVCVPRSPRCPECPVAERCAARQKGAQHELPVKSKAKPPRPEFRIAALITDETGERVLIRQRAEQGLLARMWELPHIQGTPYNRRNPANPQPSGRSVRTVLRQNRQTEALRSYLAEAGIRPREMQWHTYAEHVFSHIHWKMDVYLCRVKASDPVPADWRWIGERDRRQYAFPNIFARILAEYFDQI